MTSERDGCGCKVGRVTTKYDVPSDDSRLVEKWRNETSVRELTEQLNEDIIESALNTANAGQIKWSWSPVYEALQKDTMSEADEIEIRRELDRAGVDVGELSSDLISHQTVYRHLTQCLDASKSEEQTPEERREKARNTVFALQQRTEIVAEKTIETLQSADVTDLGETEVLVTLQVVCDDCGRSMDFESAISDGCNCNEA